MVATAVCTLLAAQGWRRTTAGCSRGLDERAMRVSGAWGAFARSAGLGVQRSAQGAREVIGSVWGAHKESGKRTGRPHRCFTPPCTRGHAPPSEASPTRPIGATLALVTQSRSDWERAEGVRRRSGGSDSGAVWCRFFRALACPGRPQPPACTAHLELRACMQQHSSTQGRRAAAAHKHHSTPALHVPCTACLPGWCSDSHLQGRVIDE